jgi:hypothetical protein
MDVVYNHTAEGSWIQDGRLADKCYNLCDDASPIGVAKLIGCLAIFKTLSTFSSGIANLSASSSGVGSRPISCSIWREVRTSLWIVSIMRSGMRIERSPTSSPSAIPLSLKADVSAEPAFFKNDTLLSATQAEICIGLRQATVTSR